MTAKDLFYEIPSLTKIERLMLDERFDAHATSPDGLVRVEGERSVRDLLESGVAPFGVVVAEDKIEKYRDILLMALRRGISVGKTGAAKFELLADTKSPAGILAAAYRPVWPKPEGGLIIALDSLADPGNVGTIIRTADWFGCSAVVLVGSTASAWSAKVVRASMGSLFRMPVFWYETWKEVRAEYRKHAIIGAVVGAPSMSTLGVAGKPVIIAMGSEAHGLGPDAARVLDASFGITSYGGAESLNVAVAAGISLAQYRGL